MMATRDILLATNNAKKAREMSEILGADDASAGDAVVRWRLLSEFADKGWPEPIEDGTTFIANAEIKARHYASLSGLWTLADDSGLEVDTLNGEPGVRSARYAGEPSNDQANNKLLIERLARVPADQRSARFHCAVVLSDGQKVLATAEGFVEGQIVDEARGNNGFGYDPHFWIVSSGMTAAEMSPDQKHAVSHRGQALRRLREKLWERVTS